MTDWNMKEIVSVRVRWLAALVFSVMLAVFLAACGASGGQDDPAEGVWGYVPEFLSIDGEEADYGRMVFSRDSLYYLSQGTAGEEGISGCMLCRYSLTDRQLTSVPIRWEDGTDGGDVNRFAVFEDGSFLLLTLGVPALEEAGGEDGSQWFLHRFDPDGNLLFSKDISSMTDSGSAIYMAVDDQGYIYIGSGSFVWRCDTDGNVQGSISQKQLPSDLSQGSLGGLGCGRDGKVYAAYHNYESLGGFIMIGALDLDYKLVELDFDGQTANLACENFSYQAGSLLPGMEADLLVYNDSGAYEYDLGTQTAQTLFDWVSCDLDGNYAKMLGVLKDGRIVVAYGDNMWGDKGGIALLTKSRMDQEAARKTLVLAAMSPDSSLQAAVVDFNKQNPDYRVTIQSFYDYSSGGTWSDALVNLNNAIASGNCPDIIDLTGLEVEKMAAKGVFEDLDPYLEKSSQLDREEILESILNAYTLDGTLVAIPKRFCVQTAVGSAEGLAGIRSWTLEDVIAFAEDHPGAELFDRASKSSVMEYLMRFNMNAFVDWSTGECHFDSEQFKSLLAFVNGFPDTAEPSMGAGWMIDSEMGGDGQSETEKIQGGEVLLSKEYLTNLESAQVYREMFQGDVVYIGYPTVDGSSGHFVPVSSNAYGISSKSEYKEGAWEFLEYMLMRQEVRWAIGFPTLKSKLEVEAKRSLNAGYVLDDNGDPVLDEDGEPIADTDSGMVYVTSGWTYTYRPSTQEEIDIVLKVLEEVRLEPESGAEIMNIINEEAEGFFQGQKTVDEVVEVIQRRVRVYVSENLL